MRLIDADELIEKINEIYKGYMTDECGSTPCDFEAIVEEQPTVYDIDKVVEEIEVNGKCVGIDSIDCPVKYCWNCEENVISIKKAIEIVKQGLKEQK